MMSDINIEASTPHAAHPKVTTVAIVQIVFFFLRNDGSKGEIGLRNRSRQVCPTNIDWGKLTGLYCSFRRIPLFPPSSVVWRLPNRRHSSTEHTMHRQRPCAAEWQNGRRTRSNSPFRGSGAFVREDSIAPASHFRLCEQVVLRTCVDKCTDSRIGSQRADC